MDRTGWFIPVHSSSSATAASATAAANNGDYSVSGMGGDCGGGVRRAAATAAVAAVAVEAAEAPPVVPDQASSRAPVAHAHEDPASSRASRAVASPN